MKLQQICLIYAVLIICAFLTGCAAPPTLTPVASLTGTPGALIELEAIDFDGNPVRLSDYRGSVVLVNFWASWCQPCKAEMPILQAYYEEHADEGFVLIGLNSGESIETGTAFMHENGLDFPAWSDPRGDLLIDLGITGLPYTLVVDAEGHRVARWFGEADRTRLDAVITPLLEKP